MFTGDELSKRAKFAFITWIGPSVGALKRARVSIDKALVKEVITVLSISSLRVKPKNSWLSKRKNFAIEIAASDLTDLQDDKIREQLIKAGGANYGTGGSKWFLQFTQNRTQYILLHSAFEICFSLFPSYIVYRFLFELIF